MSVLLFWRIKILWGRPRTISTPASHEVTVLLVGLGPRAGAWGRAPVYKESRCIDNGLIIDTTPLCQMALKFGIDCLTKALSRLRINLTSTIKYYWTMVRRRVGFLCLNSTYHTYLFGKIPRLSLLCFLISLITFLFRISSKCENVTADRRRPDRHTGCSRKPDSPQTLTHSDTESRVNDRRGLIYNLG